MTTLPAATGAPGGGAEAPGGRRAAARAEQIGWLEPRLRTLMGARLRSDLGTRALYTSDASNYRELPALVATPADIDELAALIALCGEAGFPVTMRGAGTSVAGNALGPGIIVSTRSLGRIVDVDPATMTATVEPGVILDDLNGAVARHGLRVGPDPSTHSRCTVGGMVANNACGAHSVRWGTTAQNIVGLDVIRSDGSRVRLASPSAGAGAGATGMPRVATWPGPDHALSTGLRGFVTDHEQLIRRELPPWPRRVSGFALDWLLPERGMDVARAMVGTEGTCAIVAAAAIRLVRPPVARCLLVLGFLDDIAGADAVPALLTAEPFTVESLGVELFALSHVRVTRELVPDGGAWLLVEAGGDDAGAAREHAARLAATLGRAVDQPDTRLVEDPTAQAALWRVREDGAGHASRLLDGGSAWPGFEDSAVPPARLGAYLTDLRALLRDQDLRGTTYGHYGEGCIHLRVGFGLDRPGGPERYERFLVAAAELVARHGGTLSGEHGDGRARSALLSRMFSPEMLGAFARFQALWDPRGVLNPGMVVDPPPVVASLRSSVAMAFEPRPSLRFQANGTDLRAAVDRCIGVGRCVSTQGTALMCPSYRATRDEQHSTRGRARLLQEMLAGSLSGEGWRSNAVREALDLCLGCKACVSECPTSVDMATLKSEFLHHHHRHRIRPRSHYSLGWLPAWLLLTNRLARLVNLVTRSRPTRRVFTYAAGIATDRSIPPLARRSFVRGYRSAPTAEADGVAGSRGRVVLWPDTFNNYLTPAVADAAVRVLRAAGFGVTVPQGAVCCGLTWLTTGQLDTARRVVRRTLAAPALAGDEPVVVLEPSCAALLRRDLPDLLPDDPRAASLARRVVTLAELLDREDVPAFGSRAGAAAPARSTQPPALVQPHCHQQAVLGMAADRRVMERNGIGAGSVLEGCCGLAGNFGAERGHEAIARAVAGLALLPALEASGPDTPVLADGFSCRTQIEALSGRRARHLAEVLADRLDPDGPAAVDAP